MKSNSTSDVQEGFIEFFRANGHKYLRPSKVFIPEDKTLFFVNAGMNQLKDIFLGKKEPTPGFTRLVNSQICVRIGGKKCDIEEVGDHTHLTSFSMLGSWSLSDYGKDVAIDLAYRFITERCKLDPNRIYVTYFEGNQDIPADNETRDIWKNYLPENKIRPGSFKDNFWTMGDTGPCGACTEVYYDLDGGRLNTTGDITDDPSIVEIWNNVFTEYNKDSTGYHKLDKLYIDTGMGLERLVMILQKKFTIYHTDAFRYLIGYCQALTNAEYYDGIHDYTLDHSMESMTNRSYHIFADHIRTTVMCMFDGVDFGMYEREFVLRKVFRRLLTYTYLYLNNFRVEPLFTNPIIKPLISSILNFHGKRKHNADSIWTKLVEEEKLFIGKIIHVQLFIENGLKKDNRDAVFKNLHESKGIPMEILENADKIVFV